MAHFKLPRWCHWMLNCKEIQVARQFIGSSPHRCNRYNNLQSTDNSIRSTIIKRWRVRVFITVLFAIIYFIVSLYDLSCFKIVPVCLTTDSKIPKNLRTGSVSWYKMPPAHHWIYRQCEVYLSNSIVPKMKF